MVQIEPINFCCTRLDACTHRYVRVHTHICLSICLSVCLSVCLHLMVEIEQVNFAVRHQRDDYVIGTQRSAVPEVCMCIYVERDNEYIYIYIYI